ncbi:hypothetical protein ADUPG1_008330 [Aduncisulcus paluster]|uniref:Maturase K n=1 Tax=Aduncisulcus paluster TaxID=2918883 RepID=A0ABQ5KRK2_9EUKA|nr:hypothetical protein ADUPG1_008330 [Aduncisulcus paluster]|eukprot:gnl/Carplike_NY0171/1724_a2328_617.p1 GENE.gnl/Carplike_NY0171/1724_a2328_617~~gnl/Carplike_NY0171/1724_a2328_617.p1  ORF type:complete len:408 (-),score=61.83 gnl/Carplike_NY0171/1724_a2328_617:32-1255(-)
MLESIFEGFIDGIIHISIAMNEIVDMKIRTRCIHGFRQNKLSPSHPFYHYLEFIRQYIKHLLEPPSYFRLEFLFDGAVESGFSSSIGDFHRRISRYSVPPFLHQRCISLFLDVHSLSSCFTLSSDLLGLAKVHIDATYRAILYAMIVDKKSKIQECWKWMKTAPPPSDEVSIRENLNMSFDDAPEISMPSRRPTSTNPTDVHPVPIVGRSLEHPSSYNNNNTVDSSSASTISASTIAASTISASTISASKTGLDDSVYDDSHYKREKRDEGEGEEREEEEREEDEGEKEEDSSMDFPMPRSQSAYSGSDTGFLGQKVVHNRSIHTYLYSSSQKTPISHMSLDEQHCMSFSFPGGQRIRKETPKNTAWIERKVDSIYSFLIEECNISINVGLITGVVKVPTIGHYKRE